MRFRELSVDEATTLGQVLFDFESAVPFHSLVMDIKRRRYILSLYDDSSFIRCFLSTSFGSLSELKECLNKLLDYLK